MKRKRSQELVPAAPTKRPTNDEPNGTCRLIRLLSQYGLLEAITSNLVPDDLYSLAASCKAASRAIFTSCDSRCNLLSKMLCDGKGVAIRNRCHKISKFSIEYDCISHVLCGTQDPERKVETRPCISCQATTCDECRIHCVYQSVYEPPDDSDELPNFSGFALLASPEMGILSPAHLGNSVAKWQDPRSPRTKPYHDQGFLEVPIESTMTAPCQAIDDILDFDLGSGPLELSNYSFSPRPSPVLCAFWELTERRKRWLCNECVASTSLSNDHDSRPLCHCTLRTHILGRWQCIPCYQKEEEQRQCQYRIPATETLPQSYGTMPEQCCCGTPLQAIDYPQMICLWCFGEAH